MRIAKVCVLFHGSTLSYLENTSSKKEEFLRDICIFHNESHAAEKKSKPQLLGEESLDCKSSEMHKSSLRPPFWRGLVHCFLGIDRIVDSVALIVTNTLSHLDFHGTMGTELSWLR